MTTDERNALLAANNKLASEKLLEASGQVRRALNTVQEAVALMSRCDDLAPAARVLATLADTIPAIASVPVYLDGAERHPAPAAA